MGIREFLGMPPEPRTEDVIRKDLGEAISAYHKAAQTKPAHECASLSTRVHGIQRELREKLSDGAMDCPDCGHKPIGLRHTHVVVLTGRKVFTYEVGCVVCPDHRSQGANVEEAVEQWNQQKYMKPKAR